MTGYAMAIVRLLIVVLSCASRRAAYAQPCSTLPSQEANRPKPSRQSLPTVPIRITPRQELREDPNDPGGVRNLEGRFPSAPPAGTKLRLQAEMTKPEYLRLFSSSHPGNHLSPPG